VLTQFGFSHQVAMWLKPLKEKDVETPSTEIIVLLTSRKTAGLFALRESSLKAAGELL
jgi:hypothetical protein